MGNVMNMGATAPSETPLHNDYVQRLSAQDLKRYTEGFRRVCRMEGDVHDGNAVPPPPPPLPPKGTMRRPSGNNVTNGSVNPMSATSSAGISKKLFRSKLLSAFPLIPHSLSDRLFDVLDTDGRGELTVENVLRGIALLKHGTRDEHLQLLFTIYDLDSTGLLARDVLDRFMDVVYGRRKARRPSTVALLNRVFGERKTLTLEEFKAIAEDKDEQGHAVLLEWLYALSDKIGRVDDEQIVELEKRYNPVVIRHRIAESTLFSPGEVSTLEKQFHKLFDTKGGASNRIPCDQFIDLMTRYEFPRHILERACSGSHVTVPGMVLFDEFCQIISNYCRGKVEVKCRHLFHLFCEPDGLITSCGIHDMLRQNTDNGDQNGIQNGYSRHQAKKNEAQALPDGGFRWSEDEFVDWAAESSTAQYMLHQMAFTACILFGVKPESGYLEKRIVEWHWLEATQQVEVGQTWNFIATKWWLQWCKFVGMDEANGTPLGTTLSIPQVPQEALSQDYSPGEVNVLSHVSRPGHIANWSILKTSGSRRLKEKLIIGRDFHLIPSSVYAILSHWYSGGPELSRRVIQLNNNVMQVELFPLVLRVARVDSSNGSVIMSGEEVILNRLSTVDTLLQACCKALLLTKFVEKSRLWFFDESNPDHKYRLRSRRPKDLKRLTQSSVFLIEVQDDDGSWPLSQLNSNGARTPDESDIDEEDSVDFIQSSPDDAEKRLRHQTSPLRRTSEICSRGNLETLTALGSSKHSTVPNNGKPPTAVEDEGLATAKTLKRRFSRNAFSGAGLVGLDNLGNTCYMSSALQCMSHTRLLVDYFKNEEYLHDINLHNRDGTNGKLAVAFGELLRVLWTSEKKRFAPTEFKRVLARFNPQFVGSDQHDAQELLACLLSGLSEDLNRIVKKPYIEQPDSDGRCDTIVANEWWQNHLQREFSVIVALFTGQYKSLLECSICHYESARFEPFTFLQLSLPESSFRSILVTVIFNNGRVPMKYSVRVRNDGKIEDVQTEVVDLIRRMDKRDGVPRRENIYVVVARISALHTIDAILEPKTPLLHIHERQQLSAYELDDLPEVAPTLSLEAFTSQHQGSLKKSISSSSPTAGSEHSHQASTVPDSPTATTRTSSPTGSEKHTVEESEHESESQDSGGEEDHPPFAVGSSVYVRADKTHDFLAARVIGGSTKNGPTVDVAYPSGMRRYHVPISKVLERRREDAFIFLVHRRVERSVNSFAEAHVTRLFGAPLTLRVSLRATSNFDLYMLVWRRLCRIFNWQSPPSAKSMEELLREDTLRGDEDQQQQLQRTGLSTVALGRHLAWTKFGFCLRMVTSHGIGCSRCDWLEGCLGCVILPSPTTGISVTAEETIAIDWDIRTLKEEYDPIQASKLDTHESVQINHRLENMPLNIHRCLEIFTAKEHISEAYCGRCKTLRPAEKTMDLWRLPPILVIQLKRFCYTQTSRRKLHHFVDFPLTGLNLEDFVAKKREPKRFHETGLVYWRFLGGKLKEQYEDDDQACTNGEDVPPKVTSARQFSTASTTSLLEAPATAAERADETFLYDLYAVVNHVGALGAGHYFAYVHSEDDNKWKCFNDHQCKDIDAKEVVSSSAYILFYRRRDMKDVHIEDLFPPIRRKSAGETAEVEDGANDDRAKVEELVEQTKAATNGSGCIIS